MLARHYLTILTIHSYWRWIVLASLLTSALVGLLGFAARWPFAPVGRTVCKLAVVTVDAQLLLGWCLYASSPLVRAAWANIAGAMKQHELRFLSVEHPTTVLVAIAIAHVGAWRSGQAPIDRSAYLNMAGWFAASLAFVLIGIPWWRPFFRAFSLS